MKLISKILLTVFVIFVFYQGGWTNSNQSLEYSLASPYHTIKTHLGFLQENNYHPHLSAKALTRVDITTAEAEELAIKLKQILDGSGIYIVLDELPTEKNYLDTLSGKHRYVLTERFPQIYLSKSTKDGLWRYSAQTVASIEELHDEVFPFGSDILLNVLPKLGQKKIWGLHLWQHIAIMLLILISYTIYKLLNLVFSKMISQTLSRLGYKDIAKHFILPIAKPFSILVVFLLLMFFVPVLQLPPATGQYVIKGLRAVWPLFATAIFYHLVDILGIYLERLANRTESTLDDQLVPLIKKTLKTFVIIVGGLFILQNLDFDVTALIAGLSIGGLAFALAAQDTIKNFFGSLMIFIDKPFQIGDWITSGDIDGNVEEVGFRSTRVRTFRNSVTYVPNGKLADMVIDNHGLRQYRRFYTQITVTYDTPPELIELFVEGLRKIVERHPNTRKDYYNIYLNDLSAYSLNIMFYIFFAVPTWPEELRCRHEILLDVIKLAEQLGVNFAFPTQTLHMENFPGQPTLSPEYEKDTKKLKKQMEAFLKNGKKDKGSTPESLEMFN